MSDYTIDLIGEQALTDSIIDRSITEIKDANVTRISEQALSECIALTTADFPNVTSIGERAFDSCSALITVDFPNATSIGTYAFNKCSALTSVILRNTTMTKLGNTSAFNNTPIKSGTGYIYVPLALVASYQVASNWSAYASQIRSIEGGISTTIDDRIMLRNSTVTIELSWYAPMDNPDAIPIVQVSSENTSIISVDNVVVSDNTVSFDVTSHSTDGTSIVTFIATIGDDTYTQTVTITVVESIPECTWTVEAVEGATYGFELNDDGYYESTNNGVNNSYSLCKVSFYSNGMSNMKLNCINSGESSYDFGILSTVDNTLKASSTVDSSNVFKSFKGASSTSVQTVDFGVVAFGYHFIYVKYRKDSSSSSGNDSLQFTVEFV